MAIPLQITGAGNQNARYVFKVTFSQSLSVAPYVEAWDNALTFPAQTTPGASVAKEIFIGTTGNGNIPMLYAVDTTSTSPGDDWKPAAATAGAASPNRLMGDTNYVEASVTPSAGESIYFNLGAEVPYDAAVPSTSSLAHVIQIRYRYSGSTPSISFYANEGTEASPTWTEFTPGTHGVRYCNAGTDWSAGPYKLTLPESGTVDAPEMGITT
jgi:hypothetical protein